MLPFILYLMEVSSYGSNAVDSAYKSTTNFKSSAVDR